MRVRQVAVIASFTALAVASDFALTDALNVKLVDPIVFSVAFVFGLETGIYVGVLSELIWGTVSPFGFGGYIVPFLAAGEVMYAVAGWAAAKAWAPEESPVSARNLYFGALLALCAFLWDLETNAGTAVLAFGRSLSLDKLAATEAAGIPFMLPHEVSDLVTGALLAPIIIFYAKRVAGPIVIKSTR
ncbi:MAG: hypothetical protein ACRD6W_19845 [Nitrososphaerales archaeon]